MSRKLLELETSNLVRSFYRECQAGAPIIFPESGRGLGHVTPTFFGIRSNISPKLLELQTSNLVSAPLTYHCYLFDCRVLHTMVYCEAVRSAILATAWLLVDFVAQITAIYPLYIVQCAR